MRKTHLRVAESVILRQHNVAGVLSCLAGIQRRSWVSPVGGVVENGMTLWEVAVAVGEVSVLALVSAQPQPSP